ncbi:MAG: hypothetical protein NC432_02765 [Roseburia sp.]|nr:hypothetical protein [Roseburia sp.]MCM1097929.1 hypothetical protein [Ruminococcus flavefaciens]
MPKVSVIEKRVWDIEGFQIRIMQNGVDVRGDKILPKQYEAVKRSKDPFTVSEWKAKFQSQFPGYDVEVLDADGVAVRGNTLLSTVRDTYRF